MTRSVLNYPSGHDIVTKVPTRGDRRSEGTTGGVRTEERGWRNAEMGSQARDTGSF